MGVVEFFGDIWNAITSSLLCLFLTLTAVILLILLFMIWRIIKIRGEEAWTHQPFGYKKEKKY